MLRRSCDTARPCAPGGALSGSYARAVGRNARSPRHVVRDLNSGDGIGLAGQCLKSSGDYRPSAGTIIDASNLTVNDGMGLLPAADARFRRRVAAQGSQTDSALIRTRVAPVTRVVRRLCGPRTLTRRSGSRRQGYDAVQQEARLWLRAMVAHNFHAFVERHNIAAGITDVLVTDGLIGDLEPRPGQSALETHRYAAALRVHGQLGRGMWLSARTAWLGTAVRVA